MKRIVAANGKAWLTQASDTMLYLGWEPSVDISEKDVRSVLEVSAGLVNGEPYTVLVDMTTIVSLSIGARVAFNADSRILGAALFGNGPMDRVLAAGASNAVHATRFFTSRTDALAWLAARTAQSNSVTMPVRG